MFDLTSFMVQYRRPVQVKERGLQDETSRALPKFGKELNLFEIINSWT